MVTANDIVTGSFANRYIVKVKDLPMLETLRKSGKEFRKLLKGIPEKKSGYAYGPGKWTIKEVVQHVIDAEKVFALRALWFARRDPSPLPGFEENIWGEHARGNDRDWKDLQDEFKLVRKLTYGFFETLNDEQLLTKGLANNNEMNVLAVGYLCSGHLLHHIGVLKERYL